MKKLLSLLLISLLLMTFCCSASAEEPVYSEGYFYYTVEDGSITIVGYFGNETEVTVPASIAGVPVNAIAPGAFDGTTVTKVNLPDTITAYESGGASLDVVFDANTDHPLETGDISPVSDESAIVSDESYPDEAMVDLEDSPSQTIPPQESAAPDETEQTPEEGTVPEQSSAPEQTPASEQSAPQPTAEPEKENPSQPTPAAAGTEGQETKSPSSAALITLGLGIAVGLTAVILARQKKR